MQISQKPKTFSLFFIASMKSRLTSEYFEKKDQSHSLSITELIDWVLVRSEVLGQFANTSS